MMVLPRLLARACKGGTMERHADVVRNDWRSGKQALIGHAVLDDSSGKVHFDCADHDLVAKLEEPIPAPHGGRSLTVADGIDFLAALTRRWSGDYVLVTGVHGQEKCPFADASVVEMKSKIVGV